MDRVRAWAQPWWVNLLLAIPFLIYFLWRRKGLLLTGTQFAFTTLFGAAFGFVEAAVVVYLRAAVGLLPGYKGTLADVARMSANIYQQAQAVELPPSLLTVELFREAGTIVMLVTLALLAAQRLRERWAIFLWAFAVWDVAYYAGLWATVRWPASLKDLDVLFLIPVPWFAQVWFPLLVSLLTLLALALVRNGSRRPIR
ncbi:MAG TPA: hypothetical protein VMT28_00565 [Terriglobales bacterium]|nr:hypothetical protein [Terriglobales bacterium]